MLQVSAGLTFFRPACGILSPSPDGHQNDFADDFSGSTILTLLRDASVVIHAESSERKERGPDGVPPSDSTATVHE
jgi:hypothetical protein